MYSVAPLVLRKALANVKVGQYTIPAGTAILIHVFAMHNTSANYERHAEFLPVSLRCLWMENFPVARNVLRVKLPNNIRLCSPASLHVLAQGSPWSTHGSCSVKDSAYCYGALVLHDSHHPLHPYLLSYLHALRTF